MLIALLLRVLVASIPFFLSYVPLNVDRASAILRDPVSGNCASLQPTARSMAAAAGFSHVDVSCKGVPLATFSNPAEPHTAKVRNLLGFTPVVTGSRTPIEIRAGFRLPPNVRYVSATASVTAYIKPDAVLLAVPSDDPLRGAFALESAGISRTDIVSKGSGNAGLWVRVRPVNDSQIIRVLRAMETVYSQPYLEGEVAYVFDCRRITDALAGVALQRARMNAARIANGAGGSLGALLGIVDGSADVSDGVCTSKEAATITDLVNSRGPSDMRLTFGAYVTVRRSLAAAWQLNVRASQPQAALESTPLPTPYPQPSADAVHAFINYAAERPGPEVEGDAIVSNSVKPDRAYVIAPESTYRALRIRYGTAVSYVILGARLHAAVALKPSSPKELADRVNDVNTFLDRIQMRNGKTVDRAVAVSRADCTSAQEAALFLAAKDAVAKLQGRALKYIKQSMSDIEGDVPCAFSPLVASDIYQPQGVRSVATGLATVVAGY